MGTIVSATDNALGLSGQRSIAKTRQGVLWAAVRVLASNETRIYRSLNAGASWSSQITLADAEAMSIRVVPGPDGRDWLIVGYVLDPSGGTTTQVRTKVYRLFDDGTRIVEADKSILNLEHTSRQSRVAVDGVTIGSSLYVQTVWSQDNGTNTAIYRSQTRWTTSQGYGPSATGYLHHRNNTGGVISNPSVNARRVGLFPHSQPDFLVAWSQDHVSGGDEKRVYFLRLRNSGTSWLLESVQTVYRGGFASAVASVWTGRDHVTAFAADDEPTVVKVRICGVTGANRFSADPPALNDGAVEFLSVTADPDSNDFWVLAAGATSDTVKAVKYDRSTDTWGSWVQASADVLAGPRGNAIPLSIGNTIDYVYTVSLGAPNTSVRSHVAAITNRKPFQPVWQTTDGAYNRSATLLVDWDHTDPDGDAQAAYRLRRAQIVAGVQGAWAWWNGTGWQATETHVLSATESHSLPSGWAATDGDRWVYQVATRDADLWSIYSPSLYLTAGTPITATIVSPAAGSTVTAREFLVDWSPTAPGGALIEFLTAGATVWELRTAEADSVTIRPDITNTETYTLRVTLFDAAGLAGAPASVTVSVQWPSPPQATLSVDVAQRVDSFGDTVNAGLAVSWVTAAPTSGQPPAASFDLYRYPVGEFPETPVPLSGMSKIAEGAAIDGTFEDLSAPSDTELAYVGVTVAADGTTARSDVDVPPPPPPPSPTWIEVAQVYAESVVVPDLLTWAPPGWPSFAGFQERVFTGQPAGNFIDCGSTPTILVFNGVLSQRVGIRANSHVYIPYAEFDIATTVNGPSALGRECFTLADGSAPIPGQHIFIEGLYAYGYYCAGDIFIDAHNTIVTVQNSRFEQGMWGVEVGTSTRQHPDVIHPYGGVGELRVDKVTGLLTTQGMMLSYQPSNPAANPSGTRWLRRVNFRPNNNPSIELTDPVVGQPNDGRVWPSWQLHVADDPNTGPDPVSGPIRIDNGTVVFQHNTTQITGASSSGKAIAPTAGRVSVFDAALNAWYVRYAEGNTKWRNWDNTAPGRLYEKAPPTPGGADYVGSSLAGLGYVSPGYGYTGG